MSTPALVTFGRFPEFSWIKTSGKATFLCSPTVKRLVEDEVEAGAETVVLDLADCPAMDSTFMGTIAGAAELLEEKGRKQLQVTGLTQQTERSLDTLGVAEMLDCDESEKDWSSRKDEIRSELEEATAASVDKSAHVLDAHETLCKVHTPNQKKFATVIEMLRPQVR